MKTLSLQLQREQTSRLVLYAIGTLAFATATSLGALIRIPLPHTPVPITGQTYFVLLSGLYLGTICGPLSQTLYIALGILGLPYFAGGSKGLAIMFGPTGGYLLGFIMASALTGYASQRFKKDIYIITSLICGTAIIYLLGVMQLSMFLNTDLLLALTKGAWPFIPGDVIKLALAWATWKSTLWIIKNEPKR